MYTYSGESRPIWARPVSFPFFSLSKKVKQRQPKRIGKANSVGGCVGSFFKFRETGSNVLLSGEMKIPGFTATREVSLLRWGCFNEAIILDQGCTFRDPARLDYLISF